LPDVGDEPVDEVAGAGAVVEAQREPQRVCVDLGTDRGHGPGPCQGEAHGHRVGGQGAQARDRDDGEGAQDEQAHGARLLAGRARGDDGVDDELQRPRLENAEGDLGEQGHEAAGNQGPLGPQVRTQVREGPTQRRCGAAQISGAGAHARLRTGSLWPVASARRGPGSMPARASASASSESPAAAKLRRTTWPQVRACSTVCRAARPSRCRRCGCAASWVRAAASAAGSEAGTSTPSRSWHTRSVNWPTAEATTGSPAAMYSSTFNGEKYVSPDISGAG